MPRRRGCSKTRRRCSDGRASDSGCAQANRAPTVPCATIHICVTITDVTDTDNTSAAKAAGSKATTGKTSGKSESVNKNRSRPIGTRQVTLKDIHVKNQPFELRRFHDDDGIVNLRTIFVES
jgi:hypothetical protein